LEKGKCEVDIDKDPEPDSRKIFVLYIPGFDRRRLTSKDTPFTCDLLTQYPSLRIRTLPSTELVPTLLTGTYPDQNRIFQVSLKNKTGSSLLNRVFKFVPDSVSVFLQCIYYMFDKRYELPAIPWRRRCQFDFHRFKYTRRKKDAAVLELIGGIPSLFHILKGQSRYIFVGKFAEMQRMLPLLPSADTAFEFLEFYALDIFSHWNLDRPEPLARALRAVDSVVSNLYRQCKQKAVSFLLLVDHGQERIKGTINLKKSLRRAGIPGDEYLFFMELSCTRFWFKTDRARRAILKVLADLEHVTIRNYWQMKQYHINLEDDTFGEVFVFSDHGYIFFPHDFYHSFANIFLSLASPEQRSRLFNPCHRGNHGHLPDHPSEEGYVILVDGKYQTVSDEMELIDFAPSILSLLGKPRPEYMDGQAMFIR
jgi:hypothetical protein